MAISDLRNQGLPFKGLFIGDGHQKNMIESINGTTILPFVKHAELPKYYQLADIGVWPTQESMSMLDAAACGLPIVVSNKVGEYDRIDGNGLAYKEGDFRELACSLKKMIASHYRRELGIKGRKKMIEYYSWYENAKKRLVYYAKK